MGSSLVWPSLVPCRDSNLPVHALPAYAKSAKADLSASERRATADIVAAIKLAEKKK